MRLFRIKDKAFDIANAEISGTIASTDLQWFIHVQAKRFGTDPTDWDPAAYVDAVPIDVNDWPSLAHKTVAVDGDSNSSVMDRGIGHLYVFEHTLTRQNVLTIGGRHGSTFDLRWDAVCDVFAGDDYRDNLQLSIRTPIRFTGIEVMREYKIQRACEALSTQLKIENFDIPIEPIRLGTVQEAFRFVPKCDV